MPPFVGVAVNVVEVPAHIVVPGLTFTDTDGITWLTVSVAVVVVAVGEHVPVITQRYCEPLFTEVGAVIVRVSVPTPEYIPALVNGT